MIRPGENIIPLKLQPAEAFGAEHKSELLTILFTDQVDSTRLQSELGNREASRLTDLHRAIVHDELAKYDARVIEWAGDSCLAVFAKPSDAVVSALKLQAMLRRARRDEALLHRIRIGLHVGEIVVRHHEDASKKDDLFGLQVSETARVMSLARADQIYCTRAVFDNARSVLKNESIEGVGKIVWKNYGPFELKGSDEPAEICEVGEEGLAPLLPPEANEKCVPIKGDIEKWRKRRAKGGRRRANVPIGIAVLVGAIALVLGVTLGRTTAPPAEKLPDPQLRAPDAAPPAVVRFNVALPSDFDSTFFSVAISPDGTMLAFPGSSTRSEAPIYVRPLNDFDGATRILPGTDGARSIAFSPDGEWLAYWQNRKLLKYNLANGTTETIASDFPWSPRGSTWGEDGSIVVGAEEGLIRTNSAGGEATFVTHVDPSQGEIFHMSPEWIPNQNAVLFGKWINGKESDSEICILSLDSGEVQTLQTGGVLPKYAPTGHLVYSLAGKIWAVSFDLGHRKITGEPAALADGLSMGSISAGLAIAANGTLVYAASLSPYQNAARELVQIDHDGVPRPFDIPAANFVFPSISPDGRRLAVAIGPRGNNQLWLYDLDRNSGFPLIPGNGAMPVWSPKGDWIAYRTEAGLFRVRPLPNSKPEPVLEVARSAQPSSWTPDGKELIFAQLTAKGWIILAVKADGDAGEPRLLVQTLGDATLGRVSPDGHWLAYTTNASGRPEVWVQAFPDASVVAPLLVSAQGGKDAVWSRDGATLFFVNGDSTEILGVTIAEELSKWGLPERVCALDRRLLFPGNVSSYDVTPGGQFVFARNLSEQSSLEVRVVLNWFEELKRLAPIPPAQ